MKIVGVLLFALGLGLSAHAADTASCIDIGGDFVMTGADDAILLRFKQNACASVDYAILLDKTDTIEPWFTVTYQAGPGFKDDGSGNGQKYELLLNASNAVFTVQNAGDDGNCTVSFDVSRDQNYNLVGTQTRQCGKNKAAKTPVKLFRLQ